MLRLCAHWERFVDEHLVDCVNCAPDKLSEFFGVTIPDHPKKGLCQALLFGEGYRDFRDFGALIGFTKKVLDDGSNPFLAISRTHRKRIDEVYRLRNYLSHWLTTHGGCGATSIPSRVFRAICSRGTRRLDCPVCCEHVPAVVGCVTTVPEPSSTIVFSRERKYVARSGMSSRR